MMPAHVIVVGQTPPPVHGQALAIERLVRARFEHFTVHHVRMDFSTDMEDVGRFQIRKLWRLVSLIWRVLRARAATRARILYYPPAGPRLVPVLRDMAFLTLVRPFFPVLVLDYHAGGLQDMETRLPRLLRPAFRLAYHRASLAIHKYPPEWNDRVLPARRDIVIPYGIEDVFPDFQGPRPEPGPCSLLYVGILTPNKGIWTLLDALTELRRAGTDVRLVLVGEFDSARTQTEWEHRVSRAGLGPHVRLTGPLIGEAKWLEFRRADVFCFPSHYENEALPLVVIEAMQFALPVVASRWRGIPSLVEDGLTGFLVPPEDPTTLADRVHRLARDASLRTDMGASGRQAYLARFTIEAHLSAMEEAIRTATG